MINRKAIVNRVITNVDGSKEFYISFNLNHKEYLYGPKLTESEQHKLEHMMDSPGLMMWMYRTGILKKSGSYKKKRGE